MKEMRGTMSIEKDVECSCVELEWSPIPDPACPIHGERKMKEYQVTVYRTVQQSATVMIESDRELNDTEIEYIRNKAEDKASELSDKAWQTEEVDGVDRIIINDKEGYCNYYLT